MIDLSVMRGVHVDPRARRARAQGGVTWGDYNRETQLHGLASTGGVVSTTGVAGLTLGGGLGWLMGKHGLAVDSLRAVELVTAPGEVVRASADEHPDLFWAVRGGGGNFGVATWLEYDSTRWAGRDGGARRPSFRRRARRPPLLPRLHAVAARRADRVCWRAARARRFGHEAGGDHRVSRRSPEDGAAAVAPVKRFGSPVMDVIGPMPYTAVNMLFDAGFPRGALNYWKSNFLAALATRPSTR